MNDGGLKIDIRRRAIAERLNRDGSINVSRLSAELGVSAVTIRSDLAALEKDGRLVRIQGGALPANSAEKAPVIQSEHAADIPRLAEKRAIAAAVSNIVRNGSTVFINSGTTAQLCAEALVSHRDLHIVTNCISVALALGAAPSFHVVLLGGNLNTQHGFTFGTDAEEQLRRYHADIAILSIDGICAQSGVSTCMPEEINIDRIMTEQSGKTVIAADRTKVGRAGFTNIYRELRGVLLVTDSGCNAEALSGIAECGAETLIAD